MIDSLKALKAHQGSLSLDDVDHDFLLSLNNPHQPTLTAELRELRSWFHKSLTTFLNKDVEQEEDKEAVDETIALLEKSYGGAVRFYERFYIARNGNVAKVKAMMMQMLEIRKRVLGNQLVTNVTVKNNLDDVDKISNEEFGGLVVGINKFWAIEYFGFSEKGEVVLTGAIGKIKPGKFIKDFTKAQIEKYYFHFLEIASLLVSVSNSPPFSEQPSDGTSYESRKSVEIYDFKGVSRKQLSWSGLRVLKDVLALGQVVFPEQTEQTLMINTPFFFSATWSLVSVVLDKRTREKINISRNGNEKELKKVVGESVDSLWNRVLLKSKD